MKDKWQTKKLGEVCSIFRGGSPRPIKDFLTEANDGVSWIKIGDVSKNSKYIVSTKQKIKKEGVSRSRIIYPGNFLLSNSMSFGRPYISKIEGCIHDGWLVLSLDNKVIDSNFLYYFLSSDSSYNQMDRMAQGSTVRNINIDIAKKVKLSFPKSLKEQKQIVKILDKKFEEIDKLKEITEKQIVNSKELFESRLKEIFSNKNIITKKIGEICEIVNGGTPSTKKINFWGGEILWITPKDIGKISDIYAKDTLRKITIEGLKNSSAKLIPENSVILSTRAPIGHLTINTKEMSFNQGCKGLIPYSDTDTKYLYYFLYNSKKLLNNLGSGTTFKELSVKSLGDVDVPFPAINEQEKIAEELNDLDSKIQFLENKLKKKLDLLEELKKSLLNQAFTGQL